MTSMPSHFVAGFTPGKIGLIAVLSVVLIGTVVYQFSGTGPLTVIARRPRNDKTVADADSIAVRSASETSFRAVEGKWPPISVADASQFDPFAFPFALANGRSQSTDSRPLLQPLQVESSEYSANPDYLEQGNTKSPPSGRGHRAESRPEELKRRLEEQRAIAAELQRRGVGIVFQTSQGSVARLGDLEVRVGDVLNGLRVVEINSDGIRLVPEDADGKTTE